MTLKVKKPINKVKTISVIIANFNGKRWLEDCLNSIFKQTNKDIEIIIVDNGSTDESIETVEEKYPTVKIIRNKANLGFGQANNIGARRAMGDLLLFLNSDTKLHANCLKEILHCVNDKKADLVGVKILDFNNSDYYEGRKLTLDLVGTLAWGKATTMIEGCGLAIRKTSFQKIGQFDEKFFMYSEDLDLCWRAWLLGYKIKIANRAVINHYGGGSSLPTLIGTQKHLVPAFRRYETEKNTLRMMLKNATVPHLIISLPIMLALISGESLLYLLTGQFFAATYIFKAISWNLNNLKDTLTQRQTIQSQKKKANIWPLLSKTITKFLVLKLIGIPKIKK